MVSGGLAIAAETKVDNDTQLYSQYPVHLKIGRKLSEDSGVRIRRPSAVTFQKEISKPKKDPLMKIGSDGTKRRKLTSATKKIRGEYNSKEGFAITEEMRKTHLKLNRMRKYQMLVNKKQEQQQE
eukprot:5591904-Heterocapsa_arctica.AAC.1